LIFFQEIIQNAEDAEAKSVKFLYDKKSYTTAGLEDQVSLEHQVNSQGNFRSETITFQRI
jgi:hypothetical protein